LNGVFDPGLVVHVVAAGPPANDASDCGRCFPALEVEVGLAVLFGEGEEVQQELGLGTAIFWGERPEAFAHGGEFFVCESGLSVSGRAGVVSLAGFVPAAHVLDLLGNFVCATSQVAADLLACVSRVHGPVGQELGRLVGGVVLVPDEVAGQVFEDDGPCARPSYAEREEFFCVAVGHSLLGEYPLVALVCF
jgi:hypothetical protein